MEWTHDEAYMKAVNNRPLPLPPRPDHFWINHWLKQEADSRAEEQSSRKALAELAMKNGHPIEDYVAPLSPRASTAGSDDWDSATFWPFTGVGPTSFEAIDGNRTRMYGSQYVSLSGFQEFSPFQHANGNTGSSSSSFKEENLEVPRMPSNTPTLRAIGTSPLGTLRLHEANIREVAPRQDCLLDGDVVLISGMPVGAVIGTDLNSYTVSNSSFTKGGVYQGFRELPPGLHFVWGYTKGPNVARSGFWFVSQKLATGEPGECQVLAWNKFINELDEQHVQVVKKWQKMDADEVYKACLPYARRDFVAVASKCKGVSAIDTLDQPQLWNDLTFAIKGSMLSRILRKGWNQWKVTTYTDSIQLTDVGQMVFENPRYEESRARIERPPVFGGAPELKFAFRRGDIHALRREIQQLGDAMDSTAYVRILVDQKCGEWHCAEDLIGEMQFAYINGAFLLNENCIEHFMFIVRIILRAHVWSIEQPVVFDKFLGALNAILKHDEVQQQKGDSALDNDTAFLPELKEMLVSYKSNMINQLLALGSGVTRQHMELSKTFEKLECWLLKKWDWDLRATTIKPGECPFGETDNTDEEDNDESPVRECEAEVVTGKCASAIVELDGDGRTSVCSRGSAVSYEFVIF